MLISLLSLLLLLATLVEGGGIICTDNWTECTDKANFEQSNQCKSESCSMSLVPVPGCGSFQLRSCSADYDCHKALSKGQHEHFILKRVGPSLTLDYCCNSFDKCNNLTESQLLDKFCKWAPLSLENAADAKSLCEGADNSEDSLEDVLPKLLKTKSELSPMKCACDLNIPGRFSECRSPTFEAFFVGGDQKMNDEDLVPHCYSNDGSCSLFLTLDIGRGGNTSAGIFRGCVDRKLPVSSCQDNSNVDGSFVDVEATVSSRPPYVFEYCCTAGSFCNSLTAPSAVGKMCTWMKTRLQRTVRQRRRRVSPKSSRRNYGRKQQWQRRQVGAKRRQYRKYVQIYRAFCRTDNL